MLCNFLVRKLKYFFNENIKNTANLRGYEKKISAAPTPQSSPELKIWLMILLSTTLQYYLQSCSILNNTGVISSKAKFVYVSVLVVLTFSTAPHARPRALPGRAPRQCKKNEDNYSRLLLLISF